MINIDTKFITLIGSPLGQSFAARMQNAAYAAARLNLCYFYTETGSEHLGAILEGVRHMPSFAGCAVTKPNKVAVLPYLDELDPLCAGMGACNTVVKTDDGRLLGYNTDGVGFYRSLVEEAGFTAEGRRFFCFGAGGAARAICFILAHHGAARLYITSRTPESRQRLAEELNASFSPIAAAVEPGDLSPLADCDMVINASGLGMGKTLWQSPMPKERMEPGLLYFDACYNPTKTRFLLDAEERGGRILNGLGMSLYQGAAQIELWTGQRAPVAAMRQELLNILTERGAEL